MITFEEIMSLKSEVPTGKSGEWEVKRFTVSVVEANFFNLRQRIHYRGREIEPGQYTKLVRGTSLIMSDTPAEKEDHIGFVQEAQGNILVTGLGLGWVVEALFLNKAVRFVTVIEKSQDVINLVGKYLKEKYGNKLKIICADAHEYRFKPGIRFDCVWHDIWDNICGDNWEGMKKLHRIYGKRCTIQNSWCREEVRAAKQ